MIRLISQIGINNNDPYISNTVKLKNTLFYNLIANLETNIKDKGAICKLLSNNQLKIFYYDKLESNNWIIRTYFI